jgi:hypothetical protein
MLIISSVLLASVAGAAPVSNAERLAFEARIQAVKQSANEQIKSLVARTETVSPEKQEALQSQVQEIKKATEIERLQILLEWAQIEADQEKIAEIEGVLTQLLYPTAEQKLPEIPAEKILAPGDAPVSSPNAR